MESGAPRGRHIGWLAFPLGSVLLCYLQPIQFGDRAGRRFLQFHFFTRGYRAYSFKVEGLPSGLTYNGSSTSPTISGTPDAAGSYSIEITGYRWSGLRGSSTAVYTLNLEVEAPENPTASPLSLWSDSDTTDFEMAGINPPGSEPSMETPEDGPITSSTNGSISPRPQTAAYGFMTIRWAGSTPKRKPTPIFTDIPTGTGSTICPTSPRGNFGTPAIKLRSLPETRSVGSLSPFSVHRVGKNKDARTQSFI